MTKLYLSEKAFRELVRLSKETGVPQGELVSQLIIEFARTAPEEREVAEHKCPFCSTRYFSKEALEHHEKKHTTIGAKGVDENSEVRG